ncbi:hypothetical protein G5I_04927 [Acromyrmex echinatior]|uniref:Uncharacterized protein n=1 Tax=Acromyrmex echinatior TaxID=103372 RepID=F4WGX6_ACREC|nr:hypothetical protein G5I_04927 [Acromyrmex echinatior]
MSRRLIIFRAEATRPSRQMRIDSNSPGDTSDPQRHSRICWKESVFFVAFFCMRWRISRGRFRDFTEEERRLSEMDGWIRLKTGLRRFVSPPQRTSRKRIGGTRSLQEGSSAQVTIWKRKLSNGGAHQVLETLCPNNTEENLVSSHNRCQPQVPRRIQGTRRDSNLRGRTGSMRGLATNQMDAISKFITWACDACVLPKGPRARHLCCGELESETCEDTGPSEQFDEIV